VRLGVLGGACHSLVPKTVSYYPNPRIFGNRLVSVGSVGAPLCVFRSTLQGFETIYCRPLTVIRDCLINWPRYPFMMKLCEDDYLDQLFVQL
jgi:hypothetical protein